MAHFTLLPAAPLAFYYRTTQDYLNNNFPTTQNVGIVINQPQRPAEACMGLLTTGGGNEK
jgi:hypothetical protein